MGEQNRLLTALTIAPATITQLLSHFDQRLSGIRAQKTAVSLKGHAVDEDNCHILQSHAPNTAHTKGRPKTLVQVGRHSVVEADVVVARHHTHLGGGRVDGKQAVEAIHIRGKLFWRTPLALVKEVPEEEDHVGLEVGDGGLEGAVHLPFAS